MFRENVLANETIAARIAATMVPVALDARSVRDPDTKEYAFLKRVMARPEDMQGVLILSSEGNVLGRFDGFGDMAGRAKRTIADALEAFGPVEPRQVAPVETHRNRGKGVMADGSVCFAAYVRRREDSLNSHGITAPVLSGVTLSRDDLQALAPQEAVPGARWDLPDAVVKRFCRLTSPLCAQHAPRTDSVTEAAMTGRVREIRDGKAWLIYEGRLAAVDRRGGEKLSEQELKLGGEGVYDLQAKTLRSIKILGSGRLVWTEAPDRPADFHALAEWSLGK